INAIGFDAEGDGWLVGGREGGLPFVAGTTGGPWVETLAEIEHEAGFVGGGELFSVSVVGPGSAFAAGYLLEVDAKGLTEAEMLIYQLMVKPAGEIDSRTRLPVAPIESRASSEPPGADRR